MTSHKPENDAFLAMIEAKIAALHALAESYRAAASVGAIGTPGAVGGLDSTRHITHAPIGNNGPVDIPAGAFLGKSMPEAIRLYFSLVKKKKTSKDVAGALKEGGFESTSRNFEKTVNSTMHRMRETGDLLWFKDGGFGLADFYPDSLRQRVTQDAKTKAKPPARAKKSNARGKGPVRRKSTEGGLSSDARILEILNQSPCTPATLTERLGLKSNVVGFALGRLKHRGLVERRDGGLYAVTPQTGAGLPLLLSQ